MIYDFPIEIREEIKTFLEKYDRSLRLETLYDFSATAIDQGYTPEYIGKEVESLISDFTKIQIKTSPYLPSKIQSPQFEYGLQSDVLSALSTLLRLISVIYLENPEQKDKLLGLYNKYKEFIDSDKYRIFYRSDYRSIYSDIEPKGIISDWNTIFTDVCSNIDRVAGNITLLLALNEKYDFENEEDNEDLRLDEIVPCNLNFLTNEERDEYLKSALHPELFLDITNLQDFYRVRSQFDMFYEITNPNGEFDENNFWDNALDNAEFVLSEENIQLVSPRMIQMALEIKYGQYA